MIKLGSKVLMKEIAVSCTVVAVMQRLGNIPQYECVFWMNGLRKTEWLYEYELQSISQAPIVVPQPSRSQ
jgi:hypothetical protein